nr:glycosyltransferase [uncultured Methanobacterium sp.]
MRKMISIICVYNDEEILNRFLLESLKHQTKEYELILLDNRENQFKSAAEALNHGGMISNGKYLMFVHQDVALCTDDTLENFEKALESLPDTGIASVAGKLNRRGVVTNVKHGDNFKPAGRFQITEPKKVQTVDEVLIIIPKKVFEDFKFDEDVCDNWHLYAVDYSLSMKKLGLNSYVIPSNVYHKSNGISSYNKEYYRTLKKILKKHKNSYLFIYTTMDNWSTLLSLNFQRETLWRKFNTFLDIVSENL